MIWEIREYFDNNDNFNNQSDKSWYIGGNHVISLTENEFNNHSCVQMIETIYSNSLFQFKHINTKDIQDLFENLNPRKSCSDTGLMPKLMKKVAEAIAPSVTNLYK